MFGLSGRQIFILSVLVVLLFAGTQYGPAYFAAFQFNDYIHQEVTFAVTNRRSPEMIRAEVVAKAGDLGIHRTVDHVGWLHAHEWVIAASTFAFAGLYQFTSLKYRCLEKCRSPVTFVMQHWHGRRERLQALVLGVHHGLFCLGCCWSLMLLMFAVGVGNLGWMLVLAAVMAAEKNAPWGRRLTTPLGAVLLLAGASLAVTGAFGVELLGAH